MGQQEDIEEQFLQVFRRAAHELAVAELREREELKFDTRKLRAVVDRLKDAISVPSDDSRILSYEQAGLYIGGLSRSTVEMLVEKGYLEAVDVTVGRRGIRLGELRRYADSRPVSEVSMRSPIR